MAQVSSIHPFKVGQIVIFNTSSGGEWRKNVTTGKSYIVLEATTSAYVERGHRLMNGSGPEITTYSHLVRICNDAGIVEFYGTPHFTISLSEYLRSQPTNDQRLQRWGMIMRTTLGLAQPFISLYHKLVVKITGIKVA